MDPLEFGITLSQPADVAAEASAAEALGYDFVSTGEHVFFYGPNTHGLITLAAAAGAPRRTEGAHRRPWRRRLVCLAEGC